MRDVWVIDDDNEMAYAVGLMVKLLGHTTQTFTDPQKAARLMMRNVQPSLIILDMNMPNITGFQMLDFIRQQLKWKHIPIVILSVESADVLIDRALEKGADFFLSKPMTIEELDNALNAARNCHIGQEL
jgi:CheY-like chemotaxis protein